MTTSKPFIYTLDSKYSLLQKALEFVSTMDDEEMITQYRNLVEERIQQGPGFGVEPLSMKETKAYLRETYNKKATKLVLRENMGTRSVDEARALCDKKNRKFFTTILTTEGEKARTRNYAIRLAEYDEDFNLRRRMIAADKSRPRGSGGGGIARMDQEEDNPKGKKRQHVRVYYHYPVDKYPTLE